MKREASAEQKRKRKESERNEVDAIPSHPKVETGCKAWRRRQGRQENPESRERGAGGLTSTCTNQSFCIVLKDRDEESILQRTLKTAQGKERKETERSKNVPAAPSSLRRQRGRAKTGDAKSRAADGSERESASESPAGEDRSSEQERRVDANGTDCRRRTR